ncbi:MAG: ParB/RepB/Spo0J family partition protein, partial [Paracoccus sp. (in: a-proteobacteria)]
PAQQRVPPVARIAADAATQAALDDLASELQQARATGRMIVDLPLGAIEAGHLTRDRMVMNPDDMAALTASIRDRGQQTPIEVVALEEGHYGLISGARRLTALRALFDETGDAGFATVKAVLRPASGAAETYLAMVEENEIRADLSFYERGRLAHEAARIGVFDSPAEAVKALFTHAAPAKRSKILSFVALHEALGEVLRFPEAIPEKLGLALVKTMQQDPAAKSRIVRALNEVGAETAVEERGVLDRLLKPVAPKQAAEPEEGVQIASRPGRITLSGRGVTDDLLRDLREWLARRS